MQSKKQEAVAPTTTSKSKRQPKSYERCRIKSRVNLKTSVGELLWILECSGDGKIEAKVWEGVERLLRRYIGAVHSGRVNNGRKTE
jgi:hypothetical protein